MLNNALIYIGGLITGILAVLLSGFLKAAGTDLYQTIRRKLYPPEAEPVQVERDFLPENTEGVSYSWMPEESRITKELVGYQYYYHPLKKAKCFRIGPGGQGKEWLMKKPI